MAEKNNWPITIKNYETGTLRQLYDVTENNTPVYRATYNENAAESTRTNYLHSNGGLGLNLDGQNMLLGVWDGGVVLEDHVEFTDGPFSNDSRVTNKDNATIEYHATHVAGTLVARGADNDAKGMAPSALLNAYDWNSDESEVTSEITTNGLLISNHSYGVPIFDDDGTQQIPSSWPGKYRSDARSWDIIHYNAPYYLQVVSAGNEGATSYSGALISGKDKLVNEKNSKNNLVIANAQDAQIDTNGNLLNVAINASSSQGPTDDRRIKPDIAGNGTGVYSTSNTGIQNYGQSTGTSMSSPNVAGSLILLQQHYHNLNNSYMRSATLKGVALHTADDAGRTGPDEVFGWGLLNAKKAAETISGQDAIIEELTLTQGQTYTKTVTATGLEALKASITWTDYPGNTADNVENSSTAVLINDLDIRITRNNETYFPWKLDFFSPDSDAVKGDNTVDNVERVDIESPVASASYTITITHKNTLQSSSQDYSLIITGTSSSLSINNNEVADSAINIWPNPTNDLLNISTTSNINFEDYNINIYDLQGRIVVKNITTETVDISNLNAGLYIINFSNGQNSIQKKIIKE
ncbi:S8 family serine peptidase [Mesonia phycicola]|uniref:S8 family serine peptidase n=1 Tax=Mesonia phycicola TaxID=579105 RepID=UPI0013563AAF|nr:S8 family serine peptidase [Mesonia phycicola]